MILDKNTLRRIVYFILLIPISLSVIISQTRGTWFSIFIAILLAAFLSLFASFKGQRKILSFSFAILTLLIIVIFSLNLIGRMSKTKEEFVQTRVESISNLQADYSLAMRAHSYLTVLKKIQSHPWLGNGLGATATYLFFGQYSTQNNVDSTYLTILWKMGIAGLLVFLFLYFLLLKKAFFIYRKEQDLFLRAFAVGMLSAFAAFLILGTISPILISSRFNFLFGVLFAITEILAQKTFKQRVLEKA
ncbi:MAG: O-antigen ligase family protein [bacterium]